MRIKRKSQVFKPSPYEELQVLRVLKDPKSLSLHASIIARKAIENIKVDL